MENIELIPLIKDTMVEYKLMINEQLLNEIAHPDCTMATLKLYVGQMSGAEGFALSIINLLTEEDPDGQATT